MQFPKQFLFGVAASACQFEGAALTDGKGASIWDALARRPGAIFDGSTPAVACDPYHRYREDVALMQALGVGSYRFSISWPRVLPEGRGQVNQQGLDYYKRLLDALDEAGIIPNVTLYHWDLPQALEERGGWCSRETAKWFGEYASLLFRTLGDRVRLWSTVNEPIATYVGYSGGPFAPARGDAATGRQANHHLLLAHGEAVRRFRAEGLQNSKIGIVVDIWHHHPLRPDHPADIALARLENEKSYRSYLDPIVRGRYSDALLQYLAQNNCMPEIQPGALTLISQKLDFFGLNCYNRVVDCADESLRQQRREQAVGGNFMENGAELYPKSVYDALHILTDEYKIGIPIYITENGTYNCQEARTPDGRIHDTSRIAYVKGFSQWIRKAMDEGIDVRGYYLWSLLDNWEWTAGYSMRFGLVHVDFDTQARIWKDSAYWYQAFLNEQRTG